jgi:hypothetical protein
MVLQQSPAKACLYGMLGVGGTGATLKIENTGDDAFEPYEVRAVITSHSSSSAMDGWQACLTPTAVGGDYTITASCTGCTNTTAATIERATFG